MVMKYSSSYTQSEHEVGMKRYGPAPSSDKLPTLPKQKEEFSTKKTMNSFLTFINQKSSSNVIDQMPLFHGQKKVPPMVQGQQEYLTMAWFQASTLIMKRQADKSKEEMEKSQIQLSLILQENSQLRQVE
jgi:hypothetical protein